MELPGASLYGGGSLNLDALTVAPGIAGGGEEEEAEAAEEEQRRQQELQNVLKDAFDDLIEEDEEEDATLNNTDNPSFHPENLPTSTPFMAGKERSIYDELGDQLDMRRMSELPEPSEPLSAGGGDASDYHPSATGDTGAHLAATSDADSRPVTTDHQQQYLYTDTDQQQYLYSDTDQQQCHYSDAVYMPSWVPGRYSGELTDGEFVPLQPEETNNGVTEMCDTPRQHVDTSTDISAAHYQHCYSSPRNAVTSPSPSADDVSTGDVIEAGLLHGHQPDGWPPSDRIPDTLHPGKYVASKAKDAILARTSREQLETLYEARGHEISRLRGELERQRTDATAELRAVHHQATLAQADRQGLEASLQQSRSLLVEKEDQTTKLIGEIDSLKIQLKASEDSKGDLTGRLRASEVTVSSLEQQLSELQRSDQLARNQQLHQQLVDGLQQRHADELAAQQHQLSALTEQLDSQKQQCVDLQRRLTDSEQARHQSAADKGDVINQLTAGLEAAQARCQQLMQADAAQLRHQLTAEQQQRQSTEQQLRAAQERADTLQRDLEGCESVLRLGVHDESLPADGRTTTTLTPRGAGGSSSAAGGTSAAGGGDAFSLGRELMRALENSRARRLEVTRLRTELDAVQREQQALTPQLAEKQAQITLLKKQLAEASAAAGSGEAAEQLQQQLEAEQNKRHLAEEQLRKIRTEGEKLHKTAEQLRRHLAEQVEEADRTRLQAVEEVRQACLQLHDDMMHKLRTEKIEEYETELLTLRDELTEAQREVAEVKELYVDVCREKNQLDTDMQAEREGTVAERERAVKAALDQHYDRWSGDWRARQAAAIQKALEAERARRRSQVGNVGTQTATPALSSLATQTPDWVSARALLSATATQTAVPQTDDKAVQSSDQPIASDVDKLKKKLKRASLDKRKLEMNVQQLEQNLKESACIFEAKLKKERGDAERRVRELRRRASSGGAESDLVRNLRHELQDKDDRLRQLTEQTSQEKEVLCGTFEQQLRRALDQERLLTAAVSSERSRQLQSAEQLAQQCEQLRADASRADAEHRRQLEAREQQYRTGLASYRTLIENNVAELTKAEEELRREAATSGDLLRTENARLTTENARLADSYDAVMAERKRDREQYQTQVSQLTAQSAAADELRSRVCELEARLQTSDSETAQLRTRLAASRDKLRQYHGYVKQREAHYDSEFRRLEAEYRVAVGKMKEKVMLARERCGRPPSVSVVAVQTAVTGQELVSALRDVASFQQTVAQVRGELLTMLERCQLPSAPSPPLPQPEPELATFRSHAAERRRHRSLSRADSGPPALLSGPQSEPSSLLSGPQVSPLLGTGDHALASLERIRRDLNYIFPRGERGDAAGERRTASEEMLARLARLPLTPPSRDGTART